MKGIVTALICIVLLLGLTTPLKAEFFMSHMSDARALNAEDVVIGGGVSVFDGVMGLGGNVRFGVVDAMEIGAKLGIVNYDDADHTGLGVGADIKYQLMDVSYGDAIDLAIGGAIEYYSMPQDVSGWLFGANGIISYPFELSNPGQVISPHFRLNPRFERFSANGQSDTEFEIGFAFGGTFDVSRFLSFFAEVIIGGGSIDEGFVAGVGFGI